ncbi:MAG TPA: NlpC/P60 family protein [Marmoricola sp.]|nr:NlpC/P60 family protein [Marmoricola sp.]
MLDGRKQNFARPGAALIAVLVTLGLCLVPATSASADPDQQDVERAEAKAERLYHLAEAASERYNDARVTLEQTRLRVRSLNADLERQQAKVDAMRSQVATMVVDQYQSGALSTASQVVLSEDPDQFIDNLGAVEAYNAQRGQVMDTFGTEIERLSLRKAAVKDEMKSIAALEDRLKSEKKEIDARAAEAKEELEGLEAELREARPSRSGGDRTAPVQASGRAGAAVSFAMAQVGKAYSYGAVGPNAYDCSGLTMAAWSKAGVSLPHSSSAQYSSGPHISESQLQPGDLVFYYSPISHVGMYIGNGQIVHAANPGTGVATAPLHSMPYVGAVRPG